MTFVQRLITVVLTLGTVAPPNPNTNSPAQPAAPFQGANNQTGNVLTISGLRAWAQIKYGGQAQNAAAQITIYGMTFSQMMAASTFSKWPAVQNNATVYVYAGDTSGMSLVFSGTIIQATPDFNAQPDVSLHIEAKSGLAAQMTPISPTSVEGTVSAATLLQALAGQCNPPMAFENNSNVQVQLSNPHFKGSVADQVRAICLAGAINFKIDKGTLAIWPSGQTRQTVAGAAQGITIGPNNGLVGYPTFGYNQIMAKCEYNPAIVYGTSVTIAGSSLQPANGTFSVYLIDYDLQTQTPNGAWFMFLTMTPPQNNTAN